MPKFHCPDCNQHIDAPDEYAGMQANCPACQAPIIVPQLAVAPQVAAAASPPPKKGLWAFLRFWYSRQETNAANQKTEKRPSRITSIIGTVIIAAFASAIGKSCGRSIASDRINKHQITPPPPSKHNLKEHHIAGINILLPGTPSRNKIDIPPSLRALTKSIESYIFSDRSTQIAISRIAYINPEINLDGSADGSIEGVRNLPTVTSFSSSKKNVYIQGLEAREFTMSYKNSNFQIEQFALVFARGNEMWQIQIVGEGVQNRAALEDLKKSIFESVRLSQDG